MTFSITVSVQNVTINPNSIYLYWVIYTQANDTKFCTFINWTTPNTNKDSATFGCTGTVPIAGGGGEVVEVEVGVPTGTFCGDGTCQSEGNDLGFKEDFYSCQQDCQPFDFDALIFSFTKNCWDEDPSTICIWGFGNVKIEGETTFENWKVCINGNCERLSGKTLIGNCLDKKDKNTPCFWDTNESSFFLFILMFILIALSFTRIRAPGKKKKVSPYTYVYLRVKDLRLRRRLKRLRKRKGLKGRIWKREK